MTRAWQSIPLPGQSLADLQPEICEDWNHSRNDHGPDYYKSKAGTIVWWECSVCGHEWQAKIYEITRGGKRCPSCKKDQRSWNAIPKDGDSLEDHYPKIASEWHQTKNEYSPSDYKKGSTSKVWWECSDCSHEWPALISNRTKNKAGCPACSGHVLHKDRRNSLLQKDPELARQLHPTKNGDLDPNELMPGSRSYVFWICQDCENEWEDTVAHRKGGRDCPACAGKGIHSDGRNTIAAHPLLGLEFIPERNPGVDPTQTLAQTRKRIYWKCYDCGYEWPATGSNRTRLDSGCPNCATSGFKPESPAYYYVIEIQNKLGDVIMYKGGITDDLTERFNAHKRGFSTYLEERSLKLVLSETSYFEIGESARELELRLLGIKSIRAPRIKEVSNELFLFNPLEHAREIGLI